MMMRAGFGLGMYHHGAGPEFFRAHLGMRDRRRTIHAGRLCRVGVELAAFHHTHAVKLPFGSGIFHAGLLLIF